jgi:hypothetical protein
MVLLLHSLLQAVPYMLYGPNTEKFIKKWKLKTHGSFFFAYPYGN